MATQRRFETLPQVVARLERELADTRALLVAGSPRVIAAEDVTDQTGITSATFAAGSPVCGLAFTAPPSGAVWVTVGGLPVVILSGNVTRRCELSWELRAGSTIGSGTVVLGASNIRMVAIGIGATSGLRADVEMTHRWRMTGLTPGAAYNVRTMHRVNVTGSVEGQVLHRYIAVESS